VLRHALAVTGLLLLVLPVSGNAAATIVIVGSVVALATIVIAAVVAQRVASKVLSRIISED
jgi:hypothetical protein